MFFLGKCVQTAAKTMVVDRKNQKALALLGLVSGPLQKSCDHELKRCANQVHSRTDKKDELLEGKFITWTFRLPAKRQLSILLNFFFPLLIKLFLTFVVSARIRVTMRFQTKNLGYRTGLSQVCATSYWWPFGADGWMDVQMYGRTVMWLLRHAKTSLLDRLPNLLSNATLLARYVRGVCCKLMYLQ